MASRPGIKDEDLYDALRADGASEEKAARIANAQADPDRDPSKKGGQRPPYEEWRKDQLMARARELDLEGRSSLHR